MHFWCKMLVIARYETRKMSQFAWHSSSVGASEPLQAPSATPMCRAQYSTSKKTFYCIVVTGFIITSADNVIFTAPRLHVMQRNARYCKGNSVRLSVYQTCGLWQNERILCPHSYTTRKIVYPSILTRRMVGERRPLPPGILDQIDSVPCYASAVTTSEI